MTTIIECRPSPAVPDLKAIKTEQQAAWSWGDYAVVGKPLDTNLIALIEFPPKESVSAFPNDPQYAPFAAARQRGSESRLQLIDNADVPGAIGYLPKG